MHVHRAAIRRWGSARPLAVAVALMVATPAAAQQGRDSTAATTYNIYGFVMADFGFAKVANNPQWYDVVRPSRLPAFDEQFGKDGNFFASVRQTRFGMKTATPTALGDFTTWFEFDMFGVGDDAGQTTIRPRHFYGQLGHWGAGQTNSPFMDIDVFPNTVEYWGPNGMLFLRTPQIRWIPIQGNRELMFGLEKPGGSADQGDYGDRIALQNVKARFPLPDISASWKGTTGWGYVKVAGILRVFKIDDLVDDDIDLNKSITASGITASTNINFNEKRDVLRLQATYGTGIQNYFNDAPFDVGVQDNPGNATQPFEGVPLPIIGAIAYLDHTWSSRWTSAIGGAMVDIDNSNGQPDNAYATGLYGSANLMFYPAKGVMTGLELHWARRENFNDNYSVDDLRLQYSFKYNFSLNPTSR